MASVFNRILNFFKSFNKETFENRASHFADGFYNGNSTTLSIDEMLSLTYITKSIQMIAQDVAKVKWIQKKINKKGETSIVQNSRLYWMLNRKPNREINGYTFKSLLVWNLFLYQKAAVYCHYEKINGKDYLTELIPIYPEFITKEFDENGNIQYKILTNNSYDSEPIYLTPESIIWMEYAVINNVFNVSLRALFKSTFSKLKENEEAILNSIKNDTGVAMLVNVPDITDEKTVENVRSSIQKMIKEQKKYGSIAMVKDRRWTIEPNTNVIASKIDYSTRNAIAREVAAVFGVPASKLGIEDNNKYNTMVERNRAYSDDAVKPILDIICSAFTDYFFETDMTQEITYRSIDLLSLDPNSLKDFATSAINNAFATPNEIRELIGWEPVDEGDILLANSAIQPLSVLISNTQNNNQLNDLAQEELNSNDESLSE